MITVQEFTALRKTARLRLIKMHYENQIGHIGGNLSSLDVMLFLHHVVMMPNDTFVLSKGHSVGALYITLWSQKKLTDDQLKEFHRDNTKLAGHPIPFWHESIKVATGSLGHGYPISCGMSLAKKIQKQSGRVFCLCSDGEWEEGSNWEALIFAHHHRLSNLTLIIDSNKLQGFGSLEATASLGQLKEKIEHFGLDVREGDGHDFESLSHCFQVNPSTDQTKAVILNTIKGKGISFMENRISSHYIPLNEQNFKQAYKELE